MQEKVGLALPIVHFVKDVIIHIHLDAPSPGSLGLALQVRKACVLLILEHLGLGLAGVGGVLRRRRALSDGRGWNLGGFLEFLHPDHLVTAHKLGIGPSGPLHRGGG